MPRKLRELRIDLRRAGGASIVRQRVIRFGSILTILTYEEALQRGKELIKALIAARQ
jgi:hypothetical protein